MTDLHLGERLDDVRARIDRWLDGLAADNPAVTAIDRGTSDDTSFGEPRWYVRMEWRATIRFTNSRGGK